MDIMWHTLTHTQLLKQNTIDTKQERKMANNAKQLLFKYLVIVLLFI